MASIAVSSAAAQTANPLPAARLFSWAKDGRFALTVAGIILALNLYAPADPSLLVRVLGSAIILVSAFAVWLWTTGYDRYTAFVPIFTLIYSIHFAVPVFVFMAYIYSLGREVVSEVYVERALALALTGLLCTLAGYYLVTMTTLREHLPKFKMRWRPQGGLELWAYPLSLVGLAVYFVLFLSYTGSEGGGFLRELANVPAGLCILGILTLFFLQLAGRLSWAGTLYLWGVLLPARMLLALGTGLLGHTVEPALALLLAYGTARRKMPWAAFLAFLIGFGALHPFKSAARALTWQGGAASGRSFAQKAGLYVELGQTFWQAPPPPELVLTVVFLRLSHITEFADVVRETPANVPYWKGETYYPLIFKWIPRVLWTNKPKDNVAQEFGHRYDFISPEDYKTAWVCPELEEFYINFGPAGVVAGMFFMGLIYGCIQACLIHRESGIGAIIGATYLLVRFVRSEDTLSFQLGFLRYDVLMLMMLNALLRMRWAAAPAADSP